MTNQILSELLIVFLCIISCSRVFFKVRADAASVLPFINIIFAILNLFAWGITPQELLVLILTLFVAIWNIRAILRLSSHLVVDRFTLPFKFISLINLLLSLVVGTLLVIYRPVYVNPERFYTTETISYFYFDENNKTQAVDTLFNSKDIRVHKYQNTQTGDTDKIILFVPGKCTSIHDYTPVFYKLVMDGYTVYAQEIYGKSNRWFNSILDYHFFRSFAFTNLKHKDKESYLSLLSENSSLITKEYETLLSIVNPNQRDLVILCCDGEYTDTLINVQQANKLIVDGTYDFSTCSGYTTPGLGPIEQTNPFYARVLGLKRDDTLYMSSHIATSLEKYINKGLYNRL